jgi:hypothetical protein
LTSQVFIQFPFYGARLLAGADGMPPGYYLLVQLARKLPGDSRVTIRLPSILGYILSLLSVYWFARKRLPVFAGLICALLLALSPFRDLAMEARSYTLLVGFLAISAVVWQRIDDKRFMQVLFALFLTLAFSTHYLAVVAISCFGAAELRDRLVEVVDPTIATPIVGSDTVDKTNRVLAEFVPMRVEDLAPFQAVHQKFILRSDDSYDWFTKYLAEMKYHLILLSEESGSSVYIVER